MANRTKKTEKDASFEEELAALEEIVAGLESGEVPLSQLVERYEAGMKHLKNCRAKLAEAEMRIEQLRGVSADGEPETAEFADGN